MIQIDHKEKCCGCEACVQICPKKAITFSSDVEGFGYPTVDEQACIACGLCLKVCPVLIQSTARKPLHLYAAKNENDYVRKESSSGGIFSLLAKRVIDQGGVVFGARFTEDWDVIHDYTETVMGLDVFRGSKYVQSRIGDSYTQVKRFLKTGRKVLFSGTPCQCAGLKRFLRQEYEDLLLVDFICHGVPSPGVWQRYLQEVSSSKGIPYEITAVCFRNKIMGWSHYRMTMQLHAKHPVISIQSKTLSEPFYENLYMRGFLSDLYLRPSCHACPSKSLKSGSDMTLADFWGIDQVLSELDDDQGVSLVVVNTPLGQYAYESIAKQSVAVSEEQAFCDNPSVYHSAKPHVKRASFFKKFFDPAHPVSLLIHKTLRRSLKRRILEQLKPSVKRVYNLFKS